MRVRATSGLVALGLVAAGLGALWPHAATAEGSRVGLISASKPCRTALRALLDPESTVVERDSAPGRPSSSEPDALERWIAGAVRPGSVDLVLVADVVDADTIRVLAFHDGHMVGLRLIETGKACAIEGRVAALARGWLHSRLAPRLAGGPSPRPAPAPAAVTPPPPSSPPTPSAERRPPRASDEPADPDDPGPIGPAPAPSAAPAPAAPTPAEADEVWTELPSPDEAALLVEEAPARPWLRARLGVDLVSHTLQWVAPATANTRELRFELVPTPHLELDVQLLIGRAPSWLEPTTIVARYRRTLGLVAHRTEGGPDYPLVFADLEVGLAYPVALEVEGRPLLLRPELTLRDVRVVLSAAADGAVEAELPDVAYTSLSPALALDVNVQGRVHLRGRAAYQLVLGVGDPLAALPSGSRHGFALGGGIALALSDALQLQVGLEWLGYSIRFETAAASARVRAEGVDDQTLSVSAGAQYTW
jgi:hypothetical protein